MLGLAHFTPEGRLTRGGPVFFSPALEPARGARTRASLPLFCFRSLPILLGVLCVLGAGLLPPVWGAQSSASPAPSQPVAKKKKPAGSKSRRQLAPEPARIREIQQALAREGFYQGEPSGKWDGATVTAMKNFQQSKGLQPTGKVEALSLQKLGLGSAIAGLAPPASPSPPQTASPQSDPPRKP